MFRLIILLTCFISFSAFSNEKISADQLEGLSDCDYFKYTQCTSAGLTIGACVKTKYQSFVKSCGKVHADRFLYSREMYKPKKKKNSKASCDEAHNKLCQKNGLSLESCVAKYKKEMSKACGKEIVENAKDSKKASECFNIRKKYCGDEVTIACDEIFEAKAPAHCKSATPSTKKGSAGKFSEAKMLESCMDTITKGCKMPSDEELLKEGSDVSESMRKYQVCVKRALLKSTGKCGAIFPDKEKVIKEKAVK